MTIDVIPSQRLSHKKISLFSATALNIGCMVGSGWLFSAQLAAHYAGNWSFLAILLAGMMAILIGICFASVAVAYPIVGVVTRSSSISHNEIFGMPFATANWLGILVAVSTEAQATGQYLFGVFRTPLLMMDGIVTPYGKMIEVGILIIYLMINFYGIRALARINNMVMVLKLFTPILVGTILLVAHFDSRNFDLGSVNNGIYSYKSIIAALVSAGLVYSLNGFQAVIAFAGEIENPKKNVIKTVIISITLVTVLYMLLELAFMGAVPHAYVMSHGWAHLNFASPLVDLTMLLGLHFLAILLTADSVISPSGTGYSYLGATARMLHAMAKEGQVPRWIARVAPGALFSKRAVLLNFVLATLFLINSSGWAILMVLVTGCNIIGYMAAPISMGALKPHTRIFGGVVFVLITLVMTTVPRHDIIIIASAMTLLMGSYLLLHFGRDALKKIVTLVLPFLIYLWSFYLVPNRGYAIVIALVFYILVTDRRYVVYCSKFRKKMTFDEMNNET